MTLPGVGMTSTVLADLPDPVNANLIATRIRCKGCKVRQRRLLEPSLIRFSCLYTACLKLLSSPAAWFTALQLQSLHLMYQ